MSFEPFESRVLVRKTRCSRWIAALYAGRAANGGVYAVGSSEVWPFCIPFAGNEKLLGSSGCPEQAYRPSAGSLIAVSKDRTHWHARTFIKMDSEGCYAVEGVGGCELWPCADDVRKHFKVPSVFGGGDFDF